MYNYRLTELAFVLNVSTEHGTVTDEVFLLSDIDPYTHPAHPAPPPLQVG